ncbi:c-type cytochrome [Chengkuizengella axinellae]|uniref:Cytochrome c n=1 Tax=Chengkuizengella axinellae TaxID=3064388 RepID=A0ABT9J0A6_9BACL|nr:cytochrome c [Chengkuizengella sp. 2205SS18-9]MDP5275047.1 cytochrome c [Chengkuizengella sp. 2205SS18-9]
MSKMKKVFIIISLITIFTTACGDNNNVSEENQTSTAVDKNSPAYEIYQQNGCISCHGTDLEGKMGSLTNLQDVGARLNEDEIKNTLLNGKTGTVMPAYGESLSEEDIDTLTSWLSENQ